MLRLKIGLKFQKDNELCEVRGIVDDCQIVLFCEKEATKMSKKKRYYKLIDIINFDHNVLNKVYIPITK